MSRDGRFDPPEQEKVMDVPGNAHTAWEDSLFDAQGNPREQERVMT
jgi:hypothetical protein